jgi:hypothetical protein
VSDNTCGFLKSGFISLKIDGKTKPVSGHTILPAAHYLRARLMQNAYDTLPKIGKMYMNCAEAVQTETFAQALEVAFNGDSGIAIGYHVSDDDIVCVAVEDGDGYSLWFEHFPDEYSLCEVVTGKYPWQRIVRFDRERFGVFPETGRKILVTITRADMYDKLQFGMIGGFARERLEVDIANLYELRLAVVGEKNGRPHIQIWDECDDLSGQDFSARVFRPDYEKGEVIFGDSVFGLQPEAGLRVCAITAKTSVLGDGNVRMGQLDRFVDGVHAELSAHNPQNAAGGSYPKSSAELEREIENKIYKTMRAVNMQDYTDIVKATPGLMIDCVNVISSGEYARFYGGAPHPNTVLLAVKPYCEHSARPALSEPYRRRIRENIERYRLLTTDVRILPAKYVCIEVGGRIVLTENNYLSQEQVKEQLRLLVDFVHIKKFGADIVYSRVFSRLEMLPCVSKVSQLSLSCIGDGAHKNGQGDIVLFPDALAWLGNINIEFA